MNFSFLISIKRRFCFFFFHSGGCHGKKILMLSLTRCRLGCRRPRLIVIVTVIVVVVIPIHIHIVKVVVFVGGVGGFSISNVVHVTP